jgi:ferredoxin
MRRLKVDRLACTGKGICASLLPEAIDLDEWGYPILDEAQVDPEMGNIAISLCPARALYWATVTSKAASAASPNDRRSAQGQLASRRE